MQQSNEKENGEQLHRKLKSRHLSMIALGGAIGTGIFLAMGGTLHEAGVGGAFFAYLCIGVMVYFVCTGLGEMATYLPETGSFGTYANRFVDPALGFALGWNYWYNWAITIATEIVAGALVMKFWFPSVPSGYFSALFLVIVVSLNLLSAKTYGESEFWFSVVKVITIIIFLVVGVLMIFGIIGGKYIGLTNYLTGGGPFIGGFKSFFLILLAAGYAYQGTELVGLTAGESENPEKDVPKAVNSIFWRILIFYLGTILVMGALISYQKAGVQTSAFTVIFERMGIAGAASIMNVVILTSVLSAGNSGMYASSRMLYAMAKDGMAPRIFARVNKRGVPVNGILFTTLVACACFLTSFFGSGIVYTWLVSASGLAGFVAWFGISICHYRFRKAYIAQGKDLSKLKYKARLYPLGTILAIVMCVAIVLGQGYSYFDTTGPIQWGGVISSYIGLPIFIIPYLYYKIRYKTKLIKLEDADLEVR